MTALVEIRHNPVEYCYPVEINDAEVNRVVPAIMDPCRGSEQCVYRSLCIRGLSSPDYFAGVDISTLNTDRLVSTTSCPFLSLRQAYCTFREKLFPAR